jgi:hypothetical protein
MSIIEMLEKMIRETKNNGMNGQETNKKCKQKILENIFILNYSMILKNMKFNGNPKHFHLCQSQRPRVEFHLKHPLLEILDAHMIRKSTVQFDLQY